MEASAARRLSPFLRMPTLRHIRLAREPRRSWTSRSEGGTASPGAGRYAGVVLCSAAGLLAKPMLVTLPAVLLLLDGSNDLAAPFADLAGSPDMTLLRDAIAILRRIGQEESIDLVYFGGLRSGTDAAKAIALGAMAVVYGAAAGLAHAQDVARHLIMPVLALGLFYAAI